MTVANKEAFIFLFCLKLICPPSSISLVQGHIDVILRFDSHFYQRKYWIFSSFRELLFFLLRLLFQNVISGVFLPFLILSLCSLFSSNHSNKLQFDMDYSVRSYPGVNIPTYSSGLAQKSYNIEVPIRDSRNMDIGAEYPVLHNGTSTYEKNIKQDINVHQEAEHTEVKLTRFPQIKFQVFSLIYKTLYHLPFLEPASFLLPRPPPWLAVNYEFNYRTYLRETV